MSREGCDDLVIIGRSRRVVRPGYITRCRIYIRSIPRRILYPYWLIRRITIFILNFIPIVGPIIVVIISAPDRGKKSHSRYFELKGMASKEVDQFVKARRGQYTGYVYQLHVLLTCLSNTCIYRFGLVANALEMIPIIGTFFHFSNTVSGALWAAQIERNEKKRLGSFRAAGRQKIRKMVTGYTY